MPNLTPLALDKEVRRRRAFAIIAHPHNSL